MSPRTTVGRAVALGSQVSLGVWFALPLVPILLWAGARTWTYPRTLPEEWGLSGVGDALADGAASAFVSSLMLGLVTAALATPAGAMAAYALAYGRIRHTRAISLLLLAPVFVPPFVIVMGANVALLRLHVPSPVGLALVLMVTAIPYTTFVMRSAFASYDTGIEEDARTLGARPAHVLVRIRVPMLSGALTASAFLAFLVGWSDYVITLLIGGGQFVTVPIRVAAAASGTGNEALVAALSVAAAAPPLLLLLTLTVMSRRRSSPRRDAAPMATVTASPLIGASS